MKEALEEGSVSSIANRLNKYGQWERVPPAALSDDQGGSDIDPPGLDREGEIKAAKYMANSPRINSLDAKTV